LVAAAVDDLIAQEDQYRRHLQERRQPETTERKYDK
jgi:hypothetical protein